MADKGKLVKMLDELEQAIPELKDALGGSDEDEDDDEAPGADEGKDGEQGDDDGGGMPPFALKPPKSPGPGGAGY